MTHRQLGLLAGLGLAAAAAAAWLVFHDRAERLTERPAIRAGEPHAQPPVSLPTPQEPRVDRLAPAAPSAADTAPLSVTVGGSARFDGRVVDAGGTPLAEADVWFVPSGPALRASGLAPTSWVNIFGERVENGSLDTVPLARLPRARTGADGRFAIVGRDAPVLEPDPTETDGAPFPVLVIRREGFTSVTWRAEAWKGGDFEVGDIALEPEVFATGRAVDDVGQPLAGVVVRVAANWPQPLQLERAASVLFLPELHQTRTAANGRFALHGLWPGELTLELRAADRVVVDVHHGKLEQAGALDLGDVTVPLGGAIDGSVVDEAGKPVPGAKVEGCDREIRGGLHYDVGYGYGEGDDTIHDELGQLGEGVEADSRGLFHLGGLESGNYTLYAAARGFEPTRLRDVGLGARETRLVLRREAQLLVEVRDPATGALLADAELVATRLAESPDKEGVQGILVVPLEVVTGAEASALQPGKDFAPGRFLVRGVGSVGTGLAVHSSGRAVTEAVAPGVAVSDLGHFELRPAPEAVLAGRVRDASGAGVAGARILACPEGKRFFARLIATADAEGAWEARGLGAGALNLFAQADGQAESEEQVFDLVAGESRQDADFSLPAGAVIRGVVRGADGSAAGGWVTLDVPPFGEFKWAEFSRGTDHGKALDAEGRYEFTRLRPGRYEVSVGGLGKQQLELKAGEERVLDFVELQHSRLRGRLTRAAQPMAGMKLQLRGVDARGERLGNIPDTTSDAAGRYELELRGAGTYSVEVEAPGFATAYRTLELHDSADATLDVELPSATVSGHLVRDTNGAALSQLEVQLVREDSVLMGWTATSADGSWSVGGVPEGSYVANFNGYAPTGEGWASGPAYVPVGRSVVVAEGQSLAGVDLVACAGARLSGAVTLPGGVPVKDGCMVSLVLQRDGAIVGWPDHSWVFGGEDPYTRISQDTSEIALARTEHGRYQFVALPAGSYRVAVVGGEDLAAADVIARGASITLAEHGEATLDLIAPP
jgi:hypothetical protein